MTKRLDYLDVAKGILIVMVILFHVPHIAKGFGVNETDALRILDVSTVWYTTFFMQAFFFITGRCSNFERSWKEMTKRDLTAIMLPAIAIDIVSRVIFSWDLIGTLKSLDYIWLYQGGAAWFFPALFLTKQLMWFTIRAKSIYKQLAALVCLFLIGLVWAQYGRRYCPWCLCNAMVVLPSLWLGYHYRKCETQLYEKVSIVVFPATLCFAYYLNVFPYVMLDVHITYADFPLYLLLSTTGTLGVIQICRYIQNLRFLSFVGKHTLYIYALHWGGYCCLIKILSHWITKEEVFDNLLILLILSLLCVVFPILVEYMVQFINRSIKQKTILTK